MAQRGRKKQETVSEEFKNAIASMETKELKERVVSLSKSEGEVLKSRKEDDELNEATEKLKHLKGPYSEALKVVRAQRSYVHTVLEERGQ